MSLQQRITAAIPPRGIKVAHLRAQFPSVSPAALDAALVGLRSSTQIRIAAGVVMAPGRAYEEPPPKLERTAAQIAAQREATRAWKAANAEKVRAQRKRQDALRKAHPWALANTASVAQATICRAAIEALRERDAVRREVYAAWRAVRRAA